MSDLGILGGDLSAATSLAGAANGWASGARALVAGPANAQMAYQRGQLSGAQTASALELARERRDKNLALASITPEAIADPAQAAALQAAAIRGGLNLNQINEGLFTRQKMGQQGQLFDAAVNGVGLDKLNAPLAVFHGQPVKLSEVQGNTLLDPYALPSGQADVGGNVPTAVGQADIAAAAARANASNAAAGASNASRQRQLAGITADKASNYEIIPTEDGSFIRINKLDPTATQPVLMNGQPVSGQGKGPGGGGPSLPSPETLKQAFGSDKIGGGANDKVTDFIQWQALKAQTDPKFNNGNYALQQYVLHQSGSSQAADQTAGLADAMGLSNAAQNAANATGLPQKGADGKVTALPVSLANAAAKGGQGDAPTTGVAAQVQNAVATPPVIKQSDLSSLPAPKSQAEYDALPAGATYLYTDGTVQVKGG